MNQLESKVQSTFQKEAICTTKIFGKNSISALSFHLEIDNDDILSVVILKLKTYRCSY